MKTIVLLALFLATDAHAQFYGTAGFGQAILHESGTDNTFHQNGFSDITEAHTNVWKLGVGLKINKYLDAEFDYRDLGQFNQFAGYVSDQGGQGSYNSQTKQCNGTCEPTSVSYQHGTTKGLGLSLVMHPDWNVAPFLRLGTFYHFSEFYSAQKWGQAPTQKHFAVYHSNEEAADYQTPFRNNGFGALIGVGIRAGWANIEYTHYPKVQSWASPYQNIDSVMVSVTKDF